MCCCECHHGGKHKSHHHHSGSCDCKSTDFGPAFWSNAEKTAWLEQCRDELQKEVNAIEARITALKQES